MRFRGLFGWLGDHRAVVAAIAAVAVIVGSGVAFEVVNLGSRHPAARDAASQDQRGGATATTGAVSASSGAPSSAPASSPGTPTDATPKSQGTSADVVPKPTTTVLTSGDVSAVSGRPGDTQTVTLAPGSAVPVVGHVLVGPPSPAAPYGLLGTVTAISNGPGGASIVTTTPATLDEAYSKFQVSTNQSVITSDVQLASSLAGAGQLASTTADLMTGRRPAVASAGTARLTAASGTKFDLSKAAFTCTGSANHTITVTGDLSDMSVDLSLNASPSAPSIEFLVTADPVFSVNADFTGQMDCRLTDAKFLTITIPVPAAPELDVTINPVIDLSADGKASLGMQWKPRVEVGFYKAPGTSSTSHGFGSSGSVTATANAAADLFLGFNADISLAGRVGAGGGFGPDLPVSYNSATGCVTVDSQLRADLTANANIFVKDWSFTIASGTFDKSQLYSKCAPASTASPSPSRSTSPSPSVTPTPSVSSSLVDTTTTVTASPDVLASADATITLTVTETAADGTHPAGTVDVIGADPVTVNADGVATVTVPFDTLNSLQPEPGQYLVFAAFTPTDDASYLSSSGRCAVTITGSSPSPSTTPA